MFAHWLNDSQIAINCIFNKALGQALTRFSSVKHMCVCIEEDATGAGKKSYKESQV